jgi:hypothetical protein
MTAVTVHSTVKNLRSRLIPQCIHNITGYYPPWPKIFIFGLHERIFGFGFILTESPLLFLALS